VFPHLNKFARVSVCGAISEYNLSSPPLSHNWDWIIITREVRIEGFIVSRWIPKWGDAFMNIDQWMKEGKIKVDELVETGLGNIVHAFNGMMTGANTGKVVIEIEP
jgi:NADPH-dependent curcumin reductase CurA